jgi:chromosome segregation ATPase
MDLRDENGHLKNTLAEIEAENSRLKDKYEQLGNATTQLESNLLQQSTELRRLQDENARLDKDLARTSDDLQELNNRTVHLASENSRLGAESIVANGDIGKLRGQVVQASNDIRHLTKAAKDEAAEARKDLIRRFVAIAISVGFATQIVSIGVIDHWAKAIDQWPSPSWDLNSDS